MVNLECQTERFNAKTRTSNLIYRCDVKSIHFFCTGIKVLWLLCYSYLLKAKYLKNLLAWTALNFRQNYKRNLNTNSRIKTSNTCPLTFTRMTGPRFSDTPLSEYRLKNCYIYNYDISPFCLSSCSSRGKLPRRESRNVLIQIQKICADFIRYSSVCKPH